MAHYLPYKKRILVCKDCKKEFEDTQPLAKYCPECRKKKSWGKPCVARL